MTVPAFLSIDVEPDGFQLARPGQPTWGGWRSVLETTDCLRAALAARTGVRPAFGWYVRTDPQIAEAAGRADDALVRFPERAARLRDAGDYFGVHAHPVRWSPDRGIWVHDFADADFHAHTVRFALDAFARWAGAPATRYRAGAGFLTNGMVEALDQCGVAVELGLEPVAGWGLAASAVPSGVDESPIVGRYTDCQGSPRVAYRPARHDFRVNGGRRGRRLVMIPVASRSLAPEPPLWKRAARRVLGRPWQPRVEVLYPTDERLAPHAYWDAVAAELDSMRRPYVSLGIRTDAPDSDVAVRVQRLFEALPTHPLAERLRFVDPVEAAPALA